MCVACLVSIEASACRLHATSPVGLCLEVCWDWQVVAHVEQLRGCQELISQQLVGRLPVEGLEAVHQVGGVADRVTLVGTA